jgi:hypothetical protein
MALWQFTALWQFAVIAVLIGALLIYVGILTRRVGITNATLKRIEAALLAADAVKGASPGTTAQAVETAPAGETVAAGEEGAQTPEAVVQAPEAARPREAAVTDTGSYLTLRDLKVFARAAAASEENSAPRRKPEIEDPLDTTGELPMLTMTEEPAVSATISPVNADLVLTSSESVLTSSESVLTSPESRDMQTAREAHSTSDGAAQNTNEAAMSQVPQSPPYSGAESDEDLAEKKNQDALLILNSQRRRRRARGH